MCGGGGADVVGVEGGGGGWCVYGVERVCSGLRGVGGLVCVGAEWVWSGLGGVGVCRGWSRCGRVDGGGGGGWCV